MVTDLNKGISNKISYNYLNLCDTVTSNKGTVYYVYDATGRKLSYYNGYVLTEYISNFVYENEELSYILTPEGRIKVNDSIYKYEYFLKDHLGNTRITLDQHGDIVQTAQYYPFGMRHSGYYSSESGQNYLYNGKELQDETGWYDYGARMYDPSLGRWHCIDPLAEISRRWTPYQYAYNNPIKFIDPDGMKVVTHDEESKRNIMNTLTEEEAKYVKFKKNGEIKARRLNKSESESENFTALKTEVNSETTYNYVVANEYTPGNSTESKSLSGDDNKNGTKGITLIPGAERDPSPDNDVWIYTSSKLSEERQAENTAHEGYGHAYFYELQQQGENVDPYHQYICDPDAPKTEWDEYNKVYYAPCIFIDSNTKLDKQINNVEKQAKTNYNSR